MTPDIVYFFPLFVLIGASWFFFALGREVGKDEYRREVLARRDIVRMAEMIEDDEVAVECYPPSNVVPIR
jgi:hypothetical protein